jgi:hypothetical protein
MYISRFRVPLKGEKSSVKEAKMFVLEYKSQHSCLICSENEPCCLEFHHRDRKEKEFTIAQAVSSGIALHRIAKEIEKCDLLCRNCHAKEEAKLSKERKLKNELSSHTKIT